MPISVLYCYFVCIYEMKRTIKQVTDPIQKNKQEQVEETKTRFMQSPQLFLCRALDCFYLMITLKQFD